MKRRELTLIVAVLLLGAILGGVIGDLIGTFLPEGGARTLLSKAVVVGFEPVKVDLYAISFTIGLSFKINAISVLFVVLMMIYFRWAFL